MIIITIPGYPPWNQPIAPLKKWVFGRRSFPYVGANWDHFQGLWLLVLGRVYVLSKGGYSLLWIEITQLAAAPFLNANSFVPNGGWKLAAASPQLFQDELATSATSVPFYKAFFFASEKSCTIYIYYYRHYTSKIFGIKLVGGFSPTQCLGFWIKHFRVNYPPKIS